MYNIKTTAFVFSTIIYILAFSYSHYWDSNYDIFEQPYIKYVLAMPMIIFFIYFLFSGSLINPDDRVGRFSGTNIFMSTYMSLMIVGISFVAIIMVPIIFALIFGPLSSLLGFDLMSTHTKISLLTVTPV